MSPVGETLRTLRERKPLVHNITNYVVMNETANALLALGALPVMAHAREEVEEMVGPCRARSRSTSGRSRRPGSRRCSRAGRKANELGVAVVLDPVGAGATTYRTETARRILDEVDVTVLRGNAGEVATLVGVAAEVRGVESIAAGGDPAELAREAARTLGVVASVTGPVDHVSDGERDVAVANGHELLARVTGTGCMSTAITGRVPRRLATIRSPEPPRRCRRSASPGRTPRAGAAGPGSFHVALYDALAALDPDSIGERVR